VDAQVALICFPLIFLGELPDKTMFANLVMATKGHPLQVWLGAAAAFVVHVVIAVTIGVTLFAVLPHRAIEGVVAAMFVAGAVYAWREGRNAHDDEGVLPGTSRRSAAMTAFVVIFLAEWGDLTQILTANLAAKYHELLAVGMGSVLALWAVAGIAVVGGRSLMRFVNVATVRKVTAVSLLGLAAYTLFLALR
jgi:putative Ca2+/H+ antiporter (TMEM165/GDT1 family)